MASATRFAHIAVLVSDLDRSRRFYADVLGWIELFALALDEELGAGNGIGGRGEIAMGDIDGVRLELVEMVASSRPRQGHEHCGLMMVSVEAEDLDGIASAAVAAGGGVARRVPVGGADLLVVTDPDGQELGIIGRPS